MAKNAGKTAKYNDTRFWRVLDKAALWADRRRGWHRLPTPLGLLVLIGIRDVYRKKNLHDTTAQPAVNLPPIEPFSEKLRKHRTADGSYNDLDSPMMGMAGSRFGRNVPVDRTHRDPAVLTPSPREVSLKLMTRDPFQAATAANALVASWLQFMIKDWFGHGKSPTDNPWQVPLAAGDPWPQSPMEIMRTRPDPTRPSGPSDLPPSWVNIETHWWDSSSIYGASQPHQDLVRSGEGGRLRVTDDGLIPYPTDPDLDPTLTPGFWVGLAMLHLLWTLEHNAIADHLHKKYPSLSDEDLFQHARLVNAALIAKVHTVEWTPTVIAHPVTQRAMRINWWGIAGERIHRRFGRLSKSEVISGIPGSEAHHYNVPYCLTEEFVAVYRMHPLVPDDYSLRAAADDRPLREATLRDMSGPGAIPFLKDVAAADLFYSFGTLHPGIVTLHNFPRFLQEFVRPDGGLMDLAAVDILRSRELGVPRYNEFRRLLHLAPARSFDAMTDNPVWARELADVYGGDVEAVDLMPGMYAEPRPKGFAFSDTAFRIFVLMASRRLNSDRFLTDDFTDDVYTKAGMAWIRDSTMKSVILRHYPQLRPALSGVSNAFSPWVRAA